MSGVRQPRPVLNSPAQLLEPHACGVLWGQPARIWGCSFCGLPFSPALLSSHDTPGGGQPQVFGLQRHSWLSLLQDPLVHLPGGPQSSPATPSSRGISRFLSAVAVQRPCPGVGPGSARCAPSQPWSLTTSLLLAISASSSATALQSLSLLVMSWLQSPFTLTTEPG